MLQILEQVTQETIAFPLFDSVLLHPISPSGCLSWPLFSYEWKDLRAEIFTPLESISPLLIWLHFVILCFFLIVLKYTQYKIYYLNYFWIYSIVKYIYLGNQSPELFHTAKLKLLAHYIALNFSSFIPGHLPFYFLWLCLTTPDISLKWLSFLLLAYFN